MDTARQVSARAESSRAQVFILLVDDSEDDLLLFHEAFETIDVSIQCLVANNGREALKRLEESDLKGQRPRLVLMDLNMPIMDGCTTVQRIRLSRSLLDLPVVIFTSSDLIEDSQIAYEAGANACVRKPDSYGEWVDSLRSVVGFFLGNRRTASRGERNTPRF